MKVLLIGANGRMGTQMQKYMNKIGIDFCAIDVDSLHKANEYNFDVVIDFSCHTALSQNLKIALDKNKPMLVATTNHTSTNEHMIKLASKQIPIAVCPNLSIGFVCVMEMLKNLKPIKNYDFILTETHHKQKKDAPSGSAKQILKELSKFGISPDVTAFRAGSVVGEHCLYAYGNNEIIEIKHTALSREIFCEGAIKICEKLINCKKGLYKIKDLL